MPDRRKSEVMETVLVVEDARDIRELLRRHLERAGLSVLVASTGAEGLAKLEETEPDLLLLGLALPDIDGGVLLERARPDIPVVVLAAGSSVSERIAGLSAGADDCVTRPFSPTEVVLRGRATR